jgi:eukaryotic-like serine/threonine-protein kinase
MPAAILFSFGAVLYEMATGDVPFHGESSAVICEAIMNRAPVPAVRLNHLKFPPKLEDIINKALEKDINLRYQHASEMRSDLQRLKRDTESGRMPLPISQAGDSASAAAVSNSASRGAISASSGASGAAISAPTQQPKGPYLKLAWSAIGIIIVAITTIPWIPRHRSVSTVATTGQKTLAVLPLQNLGSREGPRLSAPCPGR